MLARWTLGLAVLALSLGAPLRAQPPPTARVRVTRCLAHAKSTLVGLEALGTACPGVAEAIEHLGLSALLPKHWRKVITPRTLAGLSALAGHYRGKRLSAAPDASALSAIASTLKPQPLPPDWWDRVKAWLRYRTAPLMSRIRRWLSSLAHGPPHRAMTHTLLYVLGGLLLLTIIVFVLIELRSAGLLRSGRGRPRPRTGASPRPMQAGADGGPDWSQLRDQPARLLRLLVEALASAHRIEHDRHLTCREISARARFDSPRQREEFERVARLAERELYGPDAPPAVPEETLRAAKALRTELMTPATSAAGAP